MTCVVWFVRRAPNDHLRCISDEGAPDGLRAPRMGLRGYDDDPPADALKLLRHHSFLLLGVARLLGENADRLRRNAHLFKHFHAIEVLLQNLDAEPRQSRSPTGV